MDSYVFLRIPMFSFRAFGLSGFGAFRLSSGFTRSHDKLLFHCVLETLGAHGMVVRMLANVVTNSVERQMVVFSGSNGMTGRTITSGAKITRVVGMTANRATTSPCDSLLDVVTHSLRKNSPSPSPVPSKQRRRAVLSSGKN